MNYRMIRYILGWVLRVEGALLALPVLIALIYRESQGYAYLCCAIGCLIVGTIGSFRRPKETEIYFKDGMVAVSLSWIFMSMIGALPFVITGEIPHFINAMFEIVSGFTTTGASILSNVEALSHASLFWRSFSHWIGGMGVLVFILMLIPVKSGLSMNLMKAESPGYNVSKFVPRVRNTAILLYKIYLAMTVINILILLTSGMAWFDSLCVTFGSAGTGGFSVLNSGCATYTPFQQTVIAIFMILFGVNFGFYYLLLTRKTKSAFKMEEVRAYFLIILAAIIFIVWNVRSMYPSISETIRHSLFQVASIITTTGYSTTDFNIWPEFSKNILIILMFVGACAGSTGGGIKVSRIMIFIRVVKRRLFSYVHPYSVRKIRMDGKSVEENQVQEIGIFLAAYVLIFAASMFLISLDSFSFETNFTAVAATLNNIGPGLAEVGPMSNFGGYSILSKMILIFDMLAGRLELFPMLIFLVPGNMRLRGRKLGHIDEEG